MVTIRGERFRADITESEANWLWRGGKLPFSIQAVQKQSASIISKRGFGFIELSELPFSDLEISVIGARSRAGFCRS